MRSFLLCHFILIGPGDKKDPVAGGFFSWIYILQPLHDPLPFTAFSHDDSGEYQWPGIPGHCGDNNHSSRLCA
jgi:hypothetical protein